LLTAIMPSLGDREERGLFRRPPNKRYGIVDIRRSTRRLRRPDVGVGRLYFRHIKTKYLLLWSFIVGWTRSILKENGQSSGQKVFHSNLVSLYLLKTLLSPTIIYLTTLCQLISPVGSNRRPRRLDPQQSTRNTRDFHFERYACSVQF
jgi:hypothetical protein